MLVGDASKFEKQLAGAGFDQFEKISVSDLDLSSPTLRRQRTGAGRILPAGFQAAKSGPGAVATDEAKALIDRAVRAKGGLERLKTIRTVQAVSDTVIEVQGRKVTVPTTVRVRYPGAFRVDSDMPAGRPDAGVRQRHVLDSGSRAAPASRRRAPPNRCAATCSATPSRCCWRWPTAASRRGAAATSRSTGGRCRSSTSTSSPAVRSCWCSIPRPASFSASAIPAVAAGGDVEETFSDYRDVDGLKVAFAVTVRQPQGEATRVMRQFAVNVPLDPALFTKPS